MMMMTNNENLEDFCEKGNEKWNGCTYSNGKRGRFSVKNVRSSYKRGNH